MEGYRFINDNSSRVIVLDADGLESAWDALEETVGEDFESDDWSLTRIGDEIVEQ